MICWTFRVFGKKIETGAVGGVRGQDKHLAEGYLRLVLALCDITKGQNKQEHAN